ncbi:hypothetical protein COB64_00605 [Candidatus Wolfebacteria bacterium]|nr:MAG: hypothetical protein COB64_00605 [Candidatus Wolfebacteria bacterium]
MIHKTPPEKFKPIFEIVSCFIESDGEFLLLHRHPDKSQGNSWGVPAGKIDKGEKALDAMKRELMEETGIIKDSTDFNFFEKIYVRYPEYDFTYYMYHLPISEKPDVKLSKDEHQNYIWTSPEKSFKLNLIRDLDSCIKMFYEN